MWLKDMARVITEEFSCLGNIHLVPHPCWMQWQLSVLLLCFGITTGSTPDGMAGTASEKAFLSYREEELTFIATKVNWFSWM